MTRFSHPRFLHQRALGLALLTLGSASILATGLAGCDAPDDPQVADDSTVDSTVDLNVRSNVAATDPHPEIKLVRFDPARISLAQAREKMALLGAEILQEYGGRWFAVRLPAGYATVVQQWPDLQVHVGRVDPASIPGLDLAYERYLAAYNLVYHQEPVRSLANHLDLAQTLNEGPAQVRVTANLAPQSLSPADQAAFERQVYTPFAGGKVVVAVLLPQANGEIDPILETWDEATIRTVQANITRAIDAVARADERSRLSIVLHFESKPGSNGLPGTVESAYEAGPRFWGGSDVVMADVYSRLLGHPVSSGSEGHEEYLNNLREHYEADGVYAVAVAPNLTGAGSFRANAYINGPITFLPSSEWWGTYLHEFGHIFGALDEYCPDSCQPPTSRSGYFLTTNGNAVGSGPPQPGIRDGHGEAQRSLMISNETDAINGYTRGAWGWLDRDGNDRLDIYDSEPDAQNLSAHIDPSTGVVSLQGWVIDQPPTSAYMPFSAQRVVALDVRIDGQAAWVRLPLASAQQRRGRAEINRELGRMSAGAHTIEVKAVNSVGTVERQTLTLTVDVPAAQAASGGIIHTGELASNRLSAGTSTTLQVRANSLDRQTANVALDLDGNGTYETLGTNGNVVATQSGIQRVGWRVTNGTQVQTGSTDLVVLGENQAPTAKIDAVSAPVLGSTRPRMQWQAAQVRDDSGTAGLTYAWTIETLPPNQRVIAQSAFTSGQTSFTADVPTPASLFETFAWLRPVYESLGANSVYDFEILSATDVALALGEYGIAIVDIRDPKAPRLRAQLKTQAFAKDLLRQGTRLYVLGAEVSIVNLANFDAPSEYLHQSFFFGSSTANSSQGGPVDGANTYVAKLSPSRSSRIDTTTIDVVVNYPNHRHLVFEFYPAGQSTPIVLGQNIAGSGRKTFRFDSVNTPGLRALAGTFAAGGWSLHVRAVNAGSSSGVVERVALAFTTKARAISALSGASKLLGVRQNQLLVAGQGVQTLRVDVPTQCSVLALSSHAMPWIDGFMTTQGVVATFGDDARSHELVGYAHGSSGATRVRSVVLPGKVRDLSSCGDLFYLSFFDMPTRASYADVARTSNFIANLTSKLGETTRGFDRIWCPSATTMWSAGWGTLERLTISDPLRPQSQATYGVRLLPELASLGSDNLLHTVIDDGLNAIQLDREVSTASVIVRATLQVKDAQGAIGKVQSDHHVIPYIDDRPVIDAVRIAGAVRDDLPLELDISRQNGLKDYNPGIDVRVDIGDDGKWEENRFYGGYVGTNTLRIPNDVEGNAVPVRLEVKDGFGASSSKLVTLDIHPDFTCTASGEGCGFGSYCSFDGGAACGSAGNVGTCTASETTCPDPTPGTAVCGCDGRSYFNGCEAHLFGGTDVVSAGYCPGETDCRFIGCPEGQTCRAAWIGWLCQPDEP